jgi:glycosyltransferase involved in cell wall biosynthesis
MRILTILHDRSAGGTERIALALAGAWRAQGLDSRLLLASDEGPAQAPETVPVHCFETPRRRSLTSRFLMGQDLRTAVEAVAPDVVFLPGNWHFAMARAVARATPRPLIVAKLSNPPVPVLPAPITPIGVTAFRALLSPVDCLAHWPAARTPELRSLAPGLRLEAIPNPPLTIPPQPRGPRPPTRRGTVLVAGRLVAQKNVALALDAFAQASAQRDLRLLIAGDGPERGPLEARAAALGLANRIRFLGHQPGLAAPLAGADVLLMTSRFEGTPAVVLEALAAGVAVVSTDSSLFVRQLLTSPRRGRIVAKASPGALASALLAQLEEPEPAELSPEELSLFALPSVAADYVRLFEQLLGERAGKAAPLALESVG